MTESKLRIRLSNVEGDTSKFKITLNENNEISSSLPFESENGEGKFLSSILTCLHPVDQKQINCGDGQDDLFQWMIEQGVIEQNEARDFFYARNRYEAIGNKIYKCLFNDPRVANPIINTIEARLNDENDEILNIQIEYSPNSLNSSKISLYPWQLSYSEGHNDFLFKQKIVFSFRVISDGNNTIFRKSPVDQIKVLVIAPRVIDSEHNLHLIESTIPSLNESLKDKRLRNQIKIIDLYEDQQICSFKYMDEEVKTYKTKKVKPNIIHFDGHGVHRRYCKNPGCLEHEKPCFIDGVKKCSSCKTDLEHPEGFLLFHDNDGNPDYISATKFVDSIHDLRPQLVVIAACRSALVTEGRTVFGGIVQKLIHKNIPFVIGFQFNVTDESLKKFTKVFYDNLLNNEKPLLESFYEAAGAMAYNEWYKSVIFSAKDIPSEKLFEYDPNPYLHNPRADFPKHQIPPATPEPDPYEKKRTDELIRLPIPKSSKYIIDNYTNSKVLMEVVVCIFDSFEEVGVPRDAYEICKIAVRKIGTHYEKIQSLDPIPDEFKDFRNVLEWEISNDERFTRYKEGYRSLGQWIKNEDAYIRSQKKLPNDLYTPEQFYDHFSPILGYTSAISTLWGNIYEKFSYRYLL